MAESRPGDIFQPGELLNNTYRIEEVLGRGGTSEVYKARNDISGRFVAIKVLKSEFSGDEAFLTLMRREEEIREIRHDAVVRYSENHRTKEGLVYLVMDHVDGPGLDAVLKGGGMGAEELMAVCRRVAEGLAVAHGRRIIHRDLSPDNIILRGGRPDQAVIIDFGIAKDANPGAQTIVGNEFAGKYAYAAPEQLAGRTDARSDLYALGALLLATFRGKRPDPGANPMEVVQKKAQPLDTAGLPEPFKSLIDRLAAPDPSARFQTAEEVLRFIDAQTAEERTVIAPRAAPPAAEVAPPTVPPPPRPEVAPPTAPPAPRAAVSAPPAVAPAKSRAGLILTLVLLGLGGGGAGLWFSGALAPFLAPALPQATPFSLLIEKPEGGAPRAAGHVPNEEDRNAILAAIGAQGGTVELTLASGAIGPTWGADVLATLVAVQALDSYRIVINDMEAAVKGSTQDAALHAKVSSGLADLPGALEGQGEIALIQPEPQFLTAADLSPLLAEAADCGDLVLVDPPAVGYGKADTITVAGRMAKPDGPAALTQAILALAPERQVSMQIDLLNPALCQIEAALPAAHDGPFRFAFGFGDREGENLSGQYAVGQNPVIDLMIPPEVNEGFVSVSIIDVSGNVYHLLPNLNRPDNSVAGLRAGAAGEVAVRIAYPLSDNKDPAHIAFTVDDTSLGKSKVIVVQSDAPLFPEMRPTTESVGGYAEALAQGLAAGSLQVRSINSRILTSVAQ